VKINKEKVTEKEADRRSGTAQREDGPERSEKRKTISIRISTRRMKE
jgi:hypothetical protein